MTARQRVTVELDDELVRELSVLGEPEQVLAQLAAAAAGGALRPPQPRRTQTDASLRTERRQTDTHLAEDSNREDDRADDVVRVARDRADQVLQIAKDAALPASGAAAPRARAVLENERAAADAVVEGERAGLRRQRAGVLAVERQITDRDLSGERVHADTTLVDLREANERMVSATIRAHELADEAAAARTRAEQTARQLQLVAEFRERFIGILGHDLRTPLSSITLCAGRLLHRGKLDVHDERAVGRIISSSQRMARMITQLLDLTRARLGGGLPLEAAAADLREICQQMVGEFEARIDLQLDGDLTGVWDADRLTEALANLTGNAIEYASPETRVAIAAYADGDQVVVEIANQGPPIAPELLPFLFEPFRRGKQHEKSRAGNLGLGLYIAKEIVVAHGGTLEARSEGGVTTFAMRLPRQAP